MACKDSVAAPFGVPQLEGRQELVDNGHVIVEEVGRKADRIGNPVNQVVGELIGGVSQLIEVVGKLILVSLLIEVVGKLTEVVSQFMKVAGKLTEMVSQLMKVVGKLMVVPLMVERIVDQTVAVN